MTDVSITLFDLTPLQATIADFLWAVDSPEAMAAVYAAFPRGEVETVKTMMTSAALADQAIDRASSL